MDFNPISIEEDGFTQQQQQQQNGGAVAAAAAAASGPTGRTGAGGGSALLGSRASFGDALRACRNVYYYHTTWQVPYPEQPAAPLLYLPDEYKRLVESTVPLGVMQSELDAMQMGLLDSIPLAYYPLAPNALEEARQAARRSALMKKRAAVAVAAPAGPVAATGAADGDEGTSSLSASAGAAPGRVRAPQGRLDPGDAEIVRIVVDANEIQIRNLPSLTHVQRPLYTDIGLVPQEERHAARVARTMPPEAKPRDAAMTTEEMVRQWRLDVHTSFDEATQLDRGFVRFVAEIAHAKLGLDRRDAAHLQLVRTLWALLFNGTTKRQQRKLWYALCHFSSVFNGGPAESGAAAQLLRDAEALALPNYAASWRPLLQRYTRAVVDFVAALPGGVEQRRDHLQFHDRELDQLYTGSVYTNIELDGKLVRTSGDRLKSAVYPVEVVAVFPSGHEQAAAFGAAAVQRLRDSDELDFLAERDATLHHVVLPDAVLSKAAAARPNMLVGGCNLLVAEEGDFDNVQPGATLRYSVSAENTYQTLRQDSANTASYLLRVAQVASGEAAAAVGANADGRYVTYDRVGHRDIYQKTNNADGNTLSRYVVLFAEGPAAATHGAVRGVKRERLEASARNGSVDAPAAQELRTE